jgi:nucleotide-binding universal stress UspA family protein
MLVQKPKRNVRHNRTHPVEIQQAKRVMLALHSLEEARLLLPLAEALVSAMNAQLIVLFAMLVPDGQAFNESAGNAIHDREALAAYLNESCHHPYQMVTLALTPSEVWNAIWNMVSVESVDTLLAALPAAASPAASSRDQYATLLPDLDSSRLQAPPCDFVGVRPGCITDMSDCWADAQNILLPVRGGRRSTLALRVAHAAAQRANARLTVLHVTPPGEPLQEADWLDEFSPAIENLERIERSITLRGDLEAALLQEAQAYQMIVIGSPAGPNDAGWFSPLVGRLLEKVSATVVVVKEQYQPATLSNHPDEVGVVDRPVALVVDRWFVENTYHSREFADLERLLRLKEEQQQTISLGLPALNEEKTVGKVIQTIRTTLMDEVPLLDEIVLIDSGSDDYTREIAADLGIPVYIHSEILPQYGSYRGKGEALWKSLYVLKGDLIAWIDTDIKNIHPRFVYGILGPLLNDHRIQYTKGFYRRPLQNGEKMVAGGGGRVTELTARPFINLFFPELSGVIQPLSGEYAGRRSILERMPFFTGYGVETGLLLDLLETCGLGGIAQVDLLERIHHNQPLPNLSKMSFAIMQVVFSRLERRHAVDLLEQANLTMNLIRYQAGQRYFLEPTEIHEVERPPMIEIPEYRQMHPTRPSNPEITTT